MLRLLVSVLLLVPAVRGALVRDVRAAIQKNDFAAAERLIADFRTRNGATPEMIEAYSWLGRGALAAKDLEKAGAYAAETRRLALDALKTRKLDDEPSLPVALGASIEVQAQVTAARGERDQAVAFLRAEIGRWSETSIVTRIRKNLNLLSLEGKPAPPIPSVDIAGHPALVFLWAHWCPDCKGMAPALARIEQEFGPKGLLLVAPTRRYGYAKRGEEATPEQELAHIRSVRAAAYAAVRNMPAPVDEECFRTYGASTVPTLVLIDRGGIVRFYHPGQMTYDELLPHIQEVMRPLGRAAAASH